jgi:hypothetical protein
MKIKIIKNVLIIMLFTVNHSVKASEDQYKDNLKIILNQINHINTNNKKNNEKVSCEKVNKLSVPLENQVKKSQRCSKFLYDSILNYEFIDLIFETLENKTVNNFKQLVDIKKTGNKKIYENMTHLKQCGSNEPLIRFILKWSLEFSTGKTKSKMNVFEKELDLLNVNLFYLDLQIDKFIKFFERSY